MYATSTSLYSVCLDPSSSFGSHSLLCFTITWVAASSASAIRRFVCISAVWFWGWWPWEPFFPLWRLETSTLQMTSSRWPASLSNRWVITVCCMPLRLAYSHVCLNNLHVRSQVQLTDNLGTLSHILEKERFALLVHDQPQRKIITYYLTINPQLFPEQIIYSANRIITMSSLQNVRKYCWMQHHVSVTTDLCHSPEKADGSASQKQTVLSVVTEIDLLSYITSHKG